MRYHGLAKATGIEAGLRNSHFGRNIPKRNAMNDLRRTIHSV